MPPSKSVTDLQERVQHLERENQRLREAGASALRDSEIRYRSVFENTGTALMTCGDDGVIRHCNDEFAHRCGYPRKDIEGKMRWSDFVHPEDLERLRYFHELRSENKPAPKSYDFRMKDREGNTRYVHNTIALIPGTKERICSLIDVTERVEAEEETHRLNQFQNSIIENANVWVSVFDQDGNTLLWNQAAETISGYSRDEVLGCDKPWEWLYPDTAYRRRIRDRAVKIIEEGDTVEAYETRIRRKDGGYRVVSWYSRNLLDEQGRPAGLIALGRDVTQARKMEKILRDEKERFKILVEESPMGVALIAANGRYRYLNPKFTEIFGYSLRDIPDGTHWFRKAFPNRRYRRRLIAAWLQDLQASESGEPRPRIFTVRCKDGSEKVIQFRPAGMESGEQVVLYEDITEQKKLEAQFRRAQKMEAIGTLAGGIAHDFNNILASVIGYAELAELDVPMDSSAKQNIREVLSAANRARDLVKQILSVSRQREAERKPVKISLIIKEVMKLLRASLPATIDIRQDIPTETNYVEADPTQVHQVLMNLCTNAAHAMEERGGVLEVGLRAVDLGKRSAIPHPDLRAGPHLLLTVKDTGCGMPPEVKERIFEPYFTTKKKGTGTGLGLSTTYAILQAHDGAVTVQSVPGEGSVFNVYLPIIDAVSPEEEGSGRELQRGTERILFVDDEQPIVDFGRQILEHLGYEVTALSSSLEALALFRSEPERFDLIITDMTMPHMRGDQLAKEVLGLSPQIPVILCTGYSEHMSEKTARAAGIKAFAMKPIDLNELAGTIRAVLDDKKHG